MSDYLDKALDEISLNAADALCLQIARWCEAHSYTPTRGGDGFLYPAEHNRKRNEAFRGHVEALAREVFDSLDDEARGWPGATEAWVEIMNRESRL